MRIRLPVGEYRFRYVADSAWYTDYAAFGVEPDRFGMNSLLRVPAPLLTLPSAGARAAAAA